MPEGSLNAAQEEFLRVRERSQPDSTSPTPSGPFTPAAYLRDVRRLVRRIALLDIEVAYGSMRLESTSAFGQAGRERYERPYRTASWIAAQQKSLGRHTSMPRSKSQWRGGNVEVGEVAVTLRPDRATVEEVLAKHNRKLAAAAALTGQRRYPAYAALEADLLRNASPAAPILHRDEQEFFSARVGCIVYEPIYTIELAALCLRRHN